MRVVLVRRYCGFGYGGAERYFATLAGQLVKRGIDVIFVGERCDPLPGVRPLYVKIPVRGSIARNLAFFYLVPIKIMAGRLKDAIIYTGARIRKFHIFGTHDPLHMPWLHFTRGSRKSGFLRYLPRHCVILSLEKRVFTAEGAYFVLLSDILRKQLDTFYRFSIPADKISVIYPGVDLSEFHPPEPDRRAGEVVRNVLFVGNRSHNKGVKRLLKALDLISSKPFSCTLAGINPGTLKVPMGLKDRIKIVGYVNNLKDLYRRAHLVAIPSLYETFSNVCLEAMASGTPVIISSHAGACEIVDHGREGLHLFDPLSPAELAVRILEILEMSSTAWQEMSYLAAEKAKSFSLNGHVEKLLALFEKVLGARSKWF